MVKLKGPIMSLEAHGSIGKILTFSERGSGSQTRKYTKPLKTASPKQRAQRRLTEFLVAQWQNMTENQKNTWETAAKASDKRLAGYHYFLREAQRDLLTHTGLVAYWPCNEIIGNQIKDLSGGGHHFDLKPTPPGDAPTLATSRSARFSNALLYDGTNDYVENGNDVIPRNQGSIEILIRPDAWDGNPGGQFIIGELTDYYYNANKKISLHQAYGNIYFQIWADDDTTNLNCDVHINILNALGKYLFLTVTWENVNSGNADAEIKLYLNGVLKDSDSGEQIDFSAFDKPLRMGGRVNYWTGVIDEPCIYNRVLSAAEIYTRYNFAIKKT